MISDYGVDTADEAVFGRLQDARGQFNPANPTLPKPVGASSVQTNGAPRDSAKPVFQPPVRWSTNVTTAEENVQEASPGLKAKSAPGSPAAQAKAAGAAKQQKLGISTPKMDVSKVQGFSREMLLHHQG